MAFASFKKLPCVFPFLSRKISDPVFIHLQWIPHQAQNDNYCHSERKNVTPCENRGRNPVTLGICAWFGDRFRIKFRMTKNVFTLKTVIAGLIRNLLCLACLGHLWACPAISFFLTTPVIAHLDPQSLFFLCFPLPNNSIF